MKELKITWNYGKGNMWIDADELLSMRNIAKVRKLLKIIRESDTPEQEEIFKERIRELLSGMVGIKKAYANKAIYTKNPKNIKLTINPLIFSKLLLLYLTPTPIIIKAPPISPPIWAALSIPGTIKPNNKLITIKGII